MTTELYIETHRLDITKELSTLLTFSIDDIKNFSARSTAWSKTVVLPGTSNNNRIFGHIFQIQRSNPFNINEPNVEFNFSASKFANVVLFQDQMQTFKGVMRLLQINYSNGFNGRVEYEVNLSGNLSGLNSKLTGALLENLSFAEYDQTFTLNNILQSWDNPPGTGIYYPLIDYGNYSVNKHDWHYRALRPALYVREYIDKIFSSAGYRYNCDLFNSDSFKRLIVPHSKKEMTITTSTLVAANITSTKDYTFPSGAGGTILVQFDSNTGTGFNANATKDVFTYAGSLTTNVTLNWTFTGSFFAVGFFASVIVEIYKNGESGTQVQSLVNIFTPFTISGGVSFSISPGDTIEFRFRGEADGTLQLTSANFSIAPTSGSVAIPISLGDQLSANEAIPKNIRQIDFVVGIVKSYNLYVYEDKNDPFLIHIKPYIDFYSKNFSYGEDWSQKLDRRKVITAKPMSEINAKIYKFKFKADGDYYNDLYRKRYNEGYGDRIYDSQFEFSSQTQDMQIVFSPTPLVGYVGEDKKYSTIFKRNGNEPNFTEENIDSNIRLLRIKKITGKTPWNITDGTTTLLTLTYYGYAGHLDDPDTPQTDLNFGATKELFFSLESGNLSNNQFNTYWSSYMAEVTDKDSKLVTAYFKLDPKDILNLDFAKYIYIDGVAFRLNQIKDYNAVRPGVCLVELFKVNSASYTEATPPDGPPTGCFLLWSDEQTLDWTDEDPLVYSDCEDNQGDGDGPTPPDPTQQTISWSFSSSLLNFSSGGMRIFVNGVLAVLRTKGDSGSLILSIGDTVKAECFGSLTRRKNLTVSNTVDGLMHSNSSKAALFIDYTFTVESGKDYSITAALTT